MSVKVFKSTDTNAPKIGGWAGALTDVLLACLVNGYGSVFATGTITSNGTNVSNNDTVTIDGVTYTFKTALTPAANEVLIGASAAASLTNLAAAINLQGTSGTTYGASTLTPPSAYVSNVTSTVITLTARKGGTGGNSVAIAKSAATLTLSGANLAGGSGSDTTTSAGWTNPYNGNGGQRVFKGGSGVQHFYHVDDASPSTAALAKEGQLRGSEAATGWQNWTNPFPTTGQVSNTSGLVIRQSSTLDQTARAWLLVADDRTVNLFISTGDAGTTYLSYYFGEIYSLSSATDNYRSLIIARATANVATAGTYGTVTTIAAAALAGHYMPRSYTGAGTSLQVGKMADAAAMVNAAGGGMGAGTIVGVDPISQQLLLSPVRVVEPSVGIRGRLRGIVCPTEALTTFGDTDPIIPASGTYAGRNFQIVKFVDGNGALNACLAAVDLSGPWETN